MAKEIFRSDRLLALLEGLHFRLSLFHRNDPIASSTSFSNPFSKPGQSCSSTQMNQIINLSGGTSLQSQVFAICNCLTFNFLREYIFSTLWPTLYRIRISVVNYDLATKYYLYSLQVSTRVESHPSVIATYRPTLPMRAFLRLPPASSPW
jgi:hypothetical protein